jgi:hypothetical protein
MQLPGDAPQLVENAPGCEQDGDAACARERDRVTNGRIGPIAQGDGAVVVERECEELQGRASI